MTKMSDIRRIAWSIFWKSAILGFIGAWVVGFIIGFSAAFIAGAGFGGLGENGALVVQLVSAVVGFVISFFVFNYFFASAIGRNIGGKKLELISVEGGHTNNAH